MTRIIGFAALAVFVVSQVTDAGITAYLVSVSGNAAETNPHALEMLESQGLGALIVLKAGFVVFLVIFCFVSWRIIGLISRNGSYKVQMIAGTGQLLISGIVLFEAWEVGFKETWPWIFYWLGLWK